MDPEQRLVAAELGVRWNVALRKLQELESKLQEFDSKTQSVPLPNKQVLMSLARDLPGIWNSPSTDMCLKQRIIRILMREIVADVDESRKEIVLLIHWAGGRHSELRLKKSEMIDEKILPGFQVVECAPWQIPIEALDSEMGRREATNLRNRVRVPQSQTCDERQSIFSES